MIACVSPCFTMRSTPRRISRGPSAPPSTLTCRLRTSSVATVVTPSRRHGDGVAHSDTDVVAVDLDGIHGHGAGRGQARWMAAAQVEPRPVQPAFDGAFTHVTLG